MLILYQACGPKGLSPHPEAVVYYAPSLYSEPRK